MLKEIFFNQNEFFGLFLVHFYDFFVFYIVDFFTECSLRVVKVKVVITTKPNERKTSFAGRCSLSLCRIKNMLTASAAGLVVLINSYFTEIWVGGQARPGGRRGGGRGRGATVVVTVVKVSLNLRGQTQLKSSHSLFQQVSLAKIKYIIKNEEYHKMQL